MRFQPRRRALLRTVPAAGLLLAGAGCATPSANRTAGDPWQRAADIVARFATPLRFREEDFPITAYGAKPCTMVEVKGQTASGSFKPATLSNGVRTMVPTHITIGTRVVISTADGSYVERAKD